MDLKTLEELQVEERERVENHGGYGELTEFDTWVNDLQREMIEAFKRERGGAFLLKMNRSTEDMKKKYEYLEFTGQLIRNFEADFVLDKPYPELLELLMQRENFKDFSRSISDKIYLRINSLKGIFLFWV